MPGRFIVPIVRNVFFLAAALCLTVATHAEEATIAAAEAATPALRLESDQAVYNKDGLILWVVLVDNPDSFLREWVNPATPGSPRIQGRTAFHRGDIVLPAILYQTDGLTPEGRADIRYSFIFKRPDGSIYEEMKDKVVVDGMPPKGVGLFREMMGLKIEDTDPIGPYSLLVEVTDRVKNVTVTMPFVFTVTDPEMEKQVLEAAAPAAFPATPPVPATPTVPTTAPVGGAGTRVRSATQSPSPVPGSTATP